MESNFQRHRGHRQSQGTPTEPFGDGSDDDEHLSRPTGSAGHTYHQATASGDSRAHFGNVNAKTVNNYYGRSDEKTSYSDNIDAFKKALKFERMNARLAEIHPAHVKTCRWVVEAQEYIRWRDQSRRASHNGMFWIKGKAGVGKSTMMRLILEHLVKKNLDYHVISFFNAKGDSLEKSVEGMYRSLLHQMLNKIPRLRTAITTPEFPHENQPWDVNVLRDLFYKTVSGLLLEERLICIVDALDECGQQEIRSMVNSMYDLAETAQSSFEICVSSRHYPNITVPACEELLLENRPEHIEDIAAYISSKLVVRDELLKGKLKWMMDKKSQGVFLWVILVVRELNEQYDDGATADQLLDTLSRTPAELNLLLRSIIAGGAADSRLLPTMVWVLVAMRQLKIKELYEAIRVSTGQSVMEDHCKDELQRDRQQRFILSASKGLVEFTKPGYLRTLDYFTEVRFIHETVKKHLLTEGLAVLSHNLRTNHEGRLHAMIATWCWMFVRLICSWVHETGATESKWRQSRPLLCGYVKRYSLAHVESAYVLGSTQLTDLHEFPLPRWIQFYNFDRTITLPKPTLAAPLEPSATLLFLLLDNEHEKLAQAVLGHFAKLQELGPRCVRVEDKRFIDSTVGKGLDVWCGGKLCSPLAAAAALGYVEIVRALLDRGADPNFHGRSERPSCTALELAIKGLRMGVIVLLLDRGADLNAHHLWKGQLRHTALNTAVASHGIYRNRHDTLLQLLFSRGACPEVRELSRLLLVAAERRLIPCMRILVENGANPNARRLDGRTALHLLFRRLGDPREETKALLELGADANALGGEYGTALIEASHKGFMGTVNALLLHGADVDYRDANHGTALIKASNEGRMYTVEALLLHGADVNYRDAIHGTALIKASQKGHVVTVETLIPRSRCWLPRRKTRYCAGRCQKSTG